MSRQGGTLGQTRLEMLSYETRQAPPQSQRGTANHALPTRAKPFGFCHNINDTCTIPCAVFCEILLLSIINMKTARPLNLYWTYLLILNLCPPPVTAVPQDTLEVKTVSGADVILPCTAKQKPAVSYMTVRWYKVSQPPTPPRLRGLLARDLPNGPTQWYLGVGRELELLPASLDLLLPNVTCDDGGAYTCHLSAPVGEQNREGAVLLTLTDCQEDEILIRDSFMVVVAAAVLITALMIFLMSYKCLTAILRDRSNTSKKEVLLDGPLKPLQKKDLMLIYTLGPKISKTPTMKHMYV